MNEVARVRPADPIAFIVKYLRDNNPETLGQTDQNRMGRGGGTMSNSALHVEESPGVREPNDTGHVDS